MKTQAWGWLAVAVLAAGLNASYHDGGLQWAHQIVDRIGHNTNSVLALATGSADRFLAEAQLIAVHRQAPSCPLTAAMAEMRASMPPDFGFQRVEVMSAREQAQLARIEARRARVEAQVARIRIPAVVLDRIAIPAPQVSVCPRVRVNIPRMPRIRVAPRVVSVETFNFGPV
jgi:hypothetical protein